ncbi:hypothetical protein G5714_006101 [Onychostoma macrolepis]|uniref:Uncharacterized protein n=1 Tax=Onychostoma macrolepis TaxID=369639 RepID=A0A7J6D2W4_9TELE|nr:hypothetical protein G5714_006101 [Onychostoma macrolepis]
MNCDSGRGGLHTMRDNSPLGGGEFNTTRVSDGGEGSERRKIAPILRQGGVVSTHSGASGLLQRLVFSTGCSFPPPRDSIRNEALNTLEVSCRYALAGSG